MIFTQNRDDGENEYAQSQNKNKNKIASVIFKTFKWFIYAIGIFILGVVIYRFMSTATPSQLKNYIIQSDTIKNVYSDSISAKKDFLMYKFDQRDPFSLGDALFVENVYYLETAENLQLTMRSKNADVQGVFGSYDIASYDYNIPNPFKFYLKVTDTIPINETESETSNTSNTSSTSSADINSSLNYVIIEPVNSSSFGETADRYKYFTVSFDGVKIDYANTKVELYVFINKTEGETVFDENNTLARFTIFDINMPKTKLNAENFKIDK